MIRPPVALLMGLGAHVRAWLGRLFSYTHSTNLLFGLREGTAMLLEERLPTVFARQDHHATATLAAIAA